MRTSPTAPTTNTGSTISATIWLLAAQLVQRELNFAIIDEVDNILVDEARTPLIISGPVTKSNREYEELKPRVERLVNAQAQYVQSVLDEIEPLIGKEGKEYELGYKLLVVKRGAPKNKKPHQAA